MPLLAPLRPVNNDIPITLKWGAPGNYTLGYHTGTDFGAPNGTRVRAPRSGRVIKSEFDPEFYGHYIVVRDWKREKAFLVAHLSIRSVYVGERVVRGQKIGLSGASGYVSGFHVHAEQRHAPFGFRDNEKPDWEV